MKPLALLAGAALFLGACAAQQPPPSTIAAINVNADLSAISSRDAAAYWRSLDTDLETALASEFVGRIAPVGRTINVDVDELSLANAFTVGIGPDDARLAGRVELVEADGSTGGVFNVTASASEAALFLPPGTNIATIPPSSAEFYRAVVLAFARGTADAVNATPAD